MRGPVCSNVSFHDPLLTRSPRVAMLVRQWLLGFQAGNPDRLHAITMVETGEPPRVEIWIAVPMGEIYDIIHAVQNILDEEGEALKEREGKILIPKRLLNSFSQPLDFRITKC